MTHYERLIEKLDHFIRKYYTNKLLRGGLIFLTAILGFLLLASVGEYFMYWPAAVKLTLSGIFIAGGLYTFYHFIWVPVSKLIKIGSVLSHEEASKIVGRHFPEVKDKLLNILQLHNQAESSSSIQLLEAGIDKKAGEIVVVPFSNAVNFGLNKKYLKFLIPILACGLVILLVAPSVFTDAAERLLQPTKNFSPPAPFAFHLDQGQDFAVYQSDHTITAYVDGKVLPEKLDIFIDGQRQMMKPLGQDTFTFTFQNVTAPLKFQLNGAGYFSENFIIPLAEKPILTAIHVQIDYPDYTGKKDELRKSLGDLTLPAGTVLSWGLQTKFTDAAWLRMGQNSLKRMSAKDEFFMGTHRFLKDTTYALILKNNKSRLSETYAYQVQVTADQAPTIEVSEYRDSMMGTTILLVGSTGDDYGISRLNFNFSIENEQGQILRKGTLPLPGTGPALVAFHHQLDIHRFNLQLGEKLNYYFESWDNDAVSGPKSVRSQTMSFSRYQQKQLDSAMAKNAQEMNEGLSKSAKQSQQLQEDFSQLQNKILSASEMDWSQQSSLKEVQKQQEQLKAKLEKVQKQLEEQKKQTEQKQLSEDLKAKQEEVAKQLDNLMNKELQEMMEKIQDLMKQLDKKESFKEMQKLAEQNKLFNMDLERLQALMKQLETQIQLEAMAKKLDKMSAEQSEIQHDNEQQSTEKDALVKNQESLKKQLDALMKKDLAELSKTLNSRNEKEKLNEVNQKGNEASEQMKQSSGSMKSGQKDKASKSQSKASQNLQQMADMLSQMAGGMQMEQIEMDIRAVRQILTNLIRMSFDQEKLMNEIRQTKTSSREFLGLQQEQKRLHSNSQMIKDSLFVLSKRLFKLSATVNKETSELEKNMQLTLNAIEKRFIPEAAMRQQYVMMHTNNLALMLNEMLSNLMQMQSQAQSNQSGQCQMPGGAKPGSQQGNSPSKQLSDIISKQQQMGQGMGQNPNGTQKGNQQGQGQPGGQPGQSGKQGQQGNSGEYGNAEQLARLAEQQAAVRRQLQELNSLLNSKGMSNISNALRNAINQMDKNETDLVNKRITPQLFTRQQDILTRLLEAQNAVREQEQDNKRSSQSAQDIPKPLPPELQKILNDQNKMREAYKTVPAELKPYYKKMVDNYFHQLGN